YHYYGSANQGRRISYEYQTSSMATKSVFSCSCQIRKCLLPLEWTPNQGYTEDYAYNLERDVDQLFQ
ncbi:hypothetical protein FRX31_009426, partial [Thalictrum thalictroides]